MTCPASCPLYVASIGKIPLSDTATIAALDLSALWPVILMDGPAKARVRQAVSIARHRRTKAVWQSADWKHPAIYRALRLDPKDPAAFYAAWPFRLGKVDGQHVILAAAVPFLSTDEPETIIVWEPRANQFHILNDPQPQLLKPHITPDECAIYGDFFQFARAWIEARAIYYHRRQAQIGNQWVHPLSEPPDANWPAILAVGDIGKMRLPRDLPPVLNATGIDPDKLRKAIFRAAAIPRINDSFRIAA